MQVTVKAVWSCTWRHALHIGSSVITPKSGSLSHSGVFDCPSWQTRRPGNYNEFLLLDMHTCIHLNETCDGQNCSQRFRLKRHHFPPAYVLIRPGRIMHGFSAYTTCLTRQSVVFISGSTGTYTQPSLVVDPSFLVFVAIFFCDAMSVENATSFSKQKLEKSLRNIL